ncbi:MAG: hypothetical protein QOF89_952 [Acidobacteriota bacterium]|jgi:hypothetical protein|nr:hypothetical protein [Acidobacteriota bacterium]
MRHADRHPAYELLDDRRNLEEQRPNLVESYRDFLQDFNRYLQMEKQFKGPQQRNVPGRPALARRFR